MAERNEDRHTMSMFRGVICLCPCPCFVESPATVVLRMACMPSLALILLIRLSLLPLIMRPGVVVVVPLLLLTLFLRCSPRVRHRSDPVASRSPCKSPLEFWATKASLAAAAMLVERRAGVWGEFVRDGIGMVSRRWGGIIQKSTSI